MSLLKDYLDELRTIRTLPSTDELSYYSALEKLFNAVGEEEDPAVRCIMHLKDIGGGLPDGGLFTEDQIPESNATLFEGEIAAPRPARGAIEVKSADHSLDEVEKTDQVARYLGEYGTVLITNLRAFRLVTQVGRNARTVLDRFRLANTAEGLWELAGQTDGLEEQKEERFGQFLKRVLAHGAPLGRPQDVAWLLASYAQDAKLRLGDSPLEEMAQLRTAIETTLGVTFQGDRGERFFRSTIIQTLFYGVFSAWVLWHRDDPTRTDDFDWERTAHLLRVPVLQTLFHQLTAPGKLEELRLKELLSWTGSALNRVDRSSFFQRFSEKEAVQYFYEPFLEAFDPELREELGVWYTPSEIVKYQVRRVDTVLQEELDIADGLADDRVKILDPCCGTGAYLVETLNFLEERFREQGEGDLAPALVKEAATSRMYGFEILTAPFVVSHLQLGLRLAELGAPLKSNERAGVYLTNALTGWNPPEEPQKILFPNLKKEREQADAIKQEEDILVIFGNPPYDGFTGVAPEESEERELTEAYRGSPEGVLDPKGQGLNDLYVRFYRAAERQITENTGKGVVSYISNYSWLDRPSFPGMRTEYLKKFDHIWIDNMNGDKFRTGKRTPEGEQDPSVFSTNRSQMGIEVGTAVSVLCRSSDSDERSDLFYREFWGVEKRAELLETADLLGAEGYESLDPPPELGNPFMPRTTGDDYLEWPTLPELFLKSYPGVKTSRDSALVDTQRQRLEQRMQEYFDRNVSDGVIAEKYPALMKQTKKFNSYETREQLLEQGFKPDNIVRYCYRPMDMRWLYWESEADLLDREGPNFFPQVFDRNEFLFTTEQTRKTPGPPLNTSNLLDINSMDSGALGFPKYIDRSYADHGLFSELNGNGDEMVSNLTEMASTYLDDIGTGVEKLFYHAIGILHSPIYRQENEGALQQDWPRVPLPKDSEVLRDSARLGKEVASLIDVEQDVQGVDTGQTREELRPLGKPEHADPDKSLDPNSDFSVSAGWGYIGHHGATMPASGEYETGSYTPEEKAKLPEQALELWGQRTFNVYLNENARWANVPERVWGYRLGGYPVVKKWLSYREADILGRDLEICEVQHLKHMVRRIAALLLLEPRLDSNYEAVKAAT